MMGSNHAATGAAGWLILTTQTTIPTTWLNESMGWSLPDLVLGLGWGGLPGLAIVLGMFLVAGAAMAPDSDHHSATIASSLPPVSQWVCSGIGVVSGGHRHGTHSIVGVAVFTAIAYVAGLWRTDVGPLANVGIGAGILAVLLIAFAAKALKTIPDTMRKTPWLVGLIGGALIAVLGPEQTWWLPVAVGLGCTIHLLGDILTMEGINPVWPVAIKAPKILHGVPVLNKIWKPNGYLALPVLGSAGSVREFLVLVPVSSYVIAVTVLTLAATG